jgi:guanylate kinase
VEIARIYLEGRQPIGIVDVNGVENLRPQLDLLPIFISAPWDALEARIRAARPNDAEARLLTAAREMRLGESYEYGVVNVDLDRAIEQVAAIIRASQVIQHV